MSLMLLMMICLTGCVSQGIRVAEIVVTAYTAKVAKDTENKVEVIQKCPRWIDPFIPDQDYKDRWSRDEKEQLRVYNGSYVHNCVD